MQRNAERNAKKPSRDAKSCVSTPLCTKICPFKQPLRKCLTKGGVGAAAVLHGAKGGFRGRVIMQHSGSIAC
jgi:hypothetical protein